MEALDRSSPEILVSPPVYIRCHNGSFVLGEIVVDDADLAVADYTKEDFTAIFDGPDISIRLTDFLNAAGFKFIRLANPVSVVMSMGHSGPQIGFTPYTLGADPKLEYVVAFNVSSMESLVSAEVVPNMVEAYQQLRTPIDMTMAKSHLTIIKP